MTKFRSRSLARQRAFQVLYSLQFTPVDTPEALKTAFDNFPKDENTEDGNAELRDFAWELIEGVWSSAKELDAAIAGLSRNWRVDRLGKVELTLLRLAFYELKHHPDVPAKVVISEALDLAARFANTQARHFINGILDAAAGQNDSKA